MKCPECGRGGSTCLCYAQATENPDAPATPYTDEEIEALKKRDRDGNDARFLARVEVDAEQIEALEAERDKLKEEVSALEYRECEHCGHTPRRPKYGFGSGYKP